MICIDNAHLMDPTSWKLLGELMVEESKVAFFLIIKYDYKDRLMIPAAAKEAFDEAWTVITVDSGINIRMVEIPHLEEEDIRKIILRDAVAYRRSHINEIDDMVKIIDPQSWYANLESESETWRNRYMQQWQLQQIYTDIHPDIVRIITRKCRGNPYISLDYFKQMLQNGFISLQKDGKLEPSDKFNQCIKYNDWTSLVTPQIQKKITAQILSSFLNTKSNKPGYEEELANALVLLMTASVLGREFSVEALKHISTLPRNSQYNRCVDEAIEALEKADLIEVVDQNNGTNITCRWVQTLMRETLYQMLRFKPVKRELHKKVEDFMYLNPTKMVLNLDQVRSDQLLWHMLLAQGCEQEEGLMADRRNALTVMRIKEQLKKLPSDGIILKQQLFKAQSTGLNQIRGVGQFLSRFLVLTQKEIRWYHDINEFNSESYIGRAKLSYIYDTMAGLTQYGAKNQEIWPFQLKLSMHQTRKSKEAGKRTLILGCESQLIRDKWLATIDYLKTKSIFDAYKKKNGLVNFMADETKEYAIRRSEEAKQLDVKDLLYEFGTKLKKRTSIMSQANVIGGSLLSAVKRGASLISCQADMTLNQQKAPDLAGKLELLYKISITSFIHQLNSSSMRDNSQVFTQDEEVERLPMQFPLNLIYDTRREIARIEGKAFDETVSVLSLQSGRRSSIMQSNPFNFNDATCKIISDRGSSNVDKNKESFFGKPKTIEEHLLATLPRNISPSSPPTLQRFATKRDIYSKSRLASNTEPPFQRKGTENIEQKRFTVSQMRRPSNFSDQPYTHNYLESGLRIQEEDKEVSIEESSYLNESVPKIEVGKLTLKSSKFTELKLTPFQQNDRSILIANQQSLDCVSELIQNLEEQKGYNSVQSQQQFEASDAMAGAGRPQSNETSKKALMELISQLQTKVDLIQQEQRNMQSRIYVNDAFANAACRLDLIFQHSDLQTKSRAIQHEEFPQSQAIARFEPQFSTEQPQYETQGRPIFTFQGQHRDIGSFGKNQKDIQDEIPATEAFIKKPLKPGDRAEKLNFKLSKKRISYEPSNLASSNVTL